MSHSFYVTLFSFLFVFIIVNTANAQRDFSKWQIGVNGGILVYQGDLSKQDIGSYQTVQPVGGLYISRVLNSSFLLRTNLAIGRLYGNDASYNSPSWRQKRNYAFTSPLAEVSELLVWNMFSNNGNELAQRFSPYMFAGAGVSFLNVNRDYSKLDTTYFSSSSKTFNGLAADIARIPPRAVLVLPVGIGTEVYLTPNLSLTLETSFRYTFSDYIDGFSLGANPDKKDYYHSHTIGLLYRFGKGNKLGCPVIKR
ncbi:MAG: DUF6089 family protein [Ferruginibacter sp.]